MKAIIFDVDGTLWDTTEVVARAWQRAVEEVGVKREPITAAILKQEFGKTMNVIADNLFPMATDNEKQVILDKCCLYEHEDLHRYSGQLLYPKVRETLVELSKNYALYIVSNCQSGYIELFMAKNDLEPYIQDIECFGNTGQPKGENIKRLMERNDIHDQVVYVGDTTGDYEATRVANIPFVFAKYGFGVVTAPEYVIDEIAELLNPEFF